MITIRLNYPYREDIDSYHLPLPETFDAKGVCVLIFRDSADYYHYLDQLCDLVDNLEFDLQARYLRHNADKLKFCKQYLTLLAEVKINLFAGGSGHQSVLKSNGANHQ
jgi:hypothetical protein